jgi:hypothetical protein
MLVIIIVVVFVLLLVGVYFLGKSGVFNSKSSPTQPKTEAENQFSLGQNAYLPVSTWGTFTPNEQTNPYSGSCLNYTAISSTLSLGFPSIDSLNSGSTSYIKSTQECIDPDQILAQAGKHTCVNPNNGGGGTGCITSTAFNYNSTNYSVGDFVPVGATEGITPANPYYITCGSKACPGELGLIVPNFTNIFDPKNTLSSKPSVISPSSNYPNCIQNNGVTEPNTGAFYTGLLPCDLSDISQVFRMVRYSFDDTYTPSVDPTGIYAVIIHRATGFYLAPNMNYLQSINPITGDFVPNSYTYYFDSLIVDTDISDSTNQYVDLILINPKYDTVRNGIYWLLQNQTPDATKPSDAVDPANSLNCNTSYVYPVDVGTTVPSNCLATGVPPWYNPCDPQNPSIGNVCNATNPNTDLYFPYSPQQFVYVPNIYLVPKDTSDLVEYWTYLTNQYSIQIGSKSVLDTSKWRAVDDSYKGIWNNTIEYSLGDIVYYNVLPNDGFYLSITNNNISSTPSLPSTSDWTPIIFESSGSIAKSLPLTTNYAGVWNASRIYYGPTNNITLNPNLTGDVVTSTSSGNNYTYINIDSSAPVAPETRPVTPLPPGVAATPPTGTTPPTSPASNSYWQQIYTYSQTPSFTYVEGQLFATSDGNCYVYIGTPVVSPTTLPNLFTIINNIPLLKKFLTKIPADVYYYSTLPSIPIPQTYPNPFYGVDSSVFNILQPFGVGPNMEQISTDLGNLYGDVSQRYAVAAIVPKLTTSNIPIPTYPATPFTDTTKLLDSQFVGATNLSLQYQSPISEFKDPISYQYKGFNPFNVSQ